MDPQRTTWEVTKKEWKLKKNQRVRLTIAEDGIWYTRKDTDKPPKHVDVIPAPSIRCNDEKYRFYINKKKFQANGEVEFKEIKVALEKLIKLIEESGVKSDQQGVAHKERTQGTKFIDTEEKRREKYKDENGMQEPEEDFQKEPQQHKKLVIPKCGDVRKCDPNKKSPSSSPADTATQEGIQPVKQHHEWKVKQKQKGLIRLVFKMLGRKTTLALESNTIKIYRGKHVKMTIDLASPVHLDFVDKDCTITVVMDEKPRQFSMDKITYQEIKTVLEMTRQHYHTTAADIEVCTPVATCIQSENEFQCVVRQGINQLVPSEPNHKRQLTILRLNDDIKSLEDFTFDVLCSSDEDLKSVDLFMNNIQMGEQNNPQERRTVCGDEVGKVNDIVRKVYQDAAESMDHGHEIKAMEPLDDVVERSFKAVSPAGTMVSVNEGTGDKHQDTMKKEPILSFFDSKYDVQKAMYNVGEQLPTDYNNSDTTTQTLIMRSDSKAIPKSIDNFSDQGERYFDFMTKKASVSSHSKDDMPQNTFPVAHEIATVATAVSKTGNEVQTDRINTKVKLRSLERLLEKGKKVLKKWKMGSCHPDSKITNMQLQTDRLEPTKLGGSGEDKRTSIVDSDTPTVVKYLIKEDISARDGRNQADGVLNQANGKGLAAESSSAEDEIMCPQKRLPKAKKKKFLSITKAIMSGFEYGKVICCAFAERCLVAGGKVAKKLLETFKKATETSAKHDNETSLGFPMVEKHVTSVVRMDERPIGDAPQSLQIAGNVHNSTLLTKVFFVTTFSSLFTTASGYSSKHDMSNMIESLGISTHVAMWMGMVSMVVTVAIVIRVRGRGVRAILPRRRQMNHRENVLGQAPPNIHIGRTIRVARPNNQFALAVEEDQLPTGANQKLVISGK